MTTDSPLDVVNVYEVPGMVPVALVIGVQRDGLLLIGQHSRGVVRPYNWQYTTSDPARVTLLQQVLERALVDMRDNQLTWLAREWVTPEKVAAATKAFEDSAEDTDKGRISEAIEAVGLAGPFTVQHAYDAYHAWRAVSTGPIEAALLSLARSKIADGTI